MTKRASHLVLVLTLVAVLAACEPTPPGPVLGNARVSVSSAGGEANGESAAPSISADGRYVAFESTATNLTAEGRPGIFVHDRQSGDTTWVDEGLSPSISGDGTSVAYIHSDGTTTDILVRNLATGSTTLASVALDGGPARASDRPSMSGDGRHVAFVSFADDVVEGDDGDGQPDVFVRHIDRGVTERANVSLTGGDSNSADIGASRYSETSSVISADGRFVAFQSSAIDLVTGATGGGSDVFVRDLVADVTILASDDPRATFAFAPGMSADGSAVAYVNVQFGQINGGDVLVRDLLTGETAQANVDTGQPASFGFFAPSLNADGRLVAFESSAVNELPDNTPVSGDVYVRDLTLRRTTRVSLDADAGPPDGASFSPEISAEGGSVAYISEATDLVPDDENGLRDIFVTDLATDVHDRLLALRDLIVGFELPRGIEDSLLAKVDRATRASDAGDQELACQALLALSNQSRAQRGKKLSADQATMIITAATNIRNALGCERR